MFWCPAEGTLSFDADDVGSPDPVPNLYDPQNHVAFGPHPAMHQIAWGTMNGFNQRMLDMFYATKPWNMELSDTEHHHILMDQPALGTRLPRK